MLRVLPHELWGDLPEAFVGLEGAVIGCWGEGKVTTD